MGVLYIPVHVGTIPVARSDYLDMTLITLPFFSHTRRLRIDLDLIIV
jgi:hypothetical protein